MATQILFSEERIALAQEVKNHPKLVEVLQGMDAGPDDWELRLAAIAHYCGIVVDGEYMPSELDKLADICYWRLRSRNTIEVTTLQ